MPSLKEQKVPAPLVVHDLDECYRLLGGGPVATVGLQRHPLPTALSASYAIEGRDIVLTIDARSAAALLGSSVSVSIVVSDSRTASTWRVVAIGTAEECSRGVCVRPTSVLAYCVSSGGTDTVVLT